MSEVDNFTITVPLADMEMRRVLVDVAQSFVDAEACIHPSRSTISSGAQHVKPGSKPPSGSTAAVDLCRRIIRKANAIITDVQQFERLLDPKERKAAAEFKEQVRVAKARMREEDEAALRSVYPPVPSCREG